MVEELAEKNTVNKSTKLKKNKNREERKKGAVAYEKNFEQVAKNIEMNDFSDEIKKYQQIMNSNVIFPLDYRIIDPSENIRMEKIDVNEEEFQNLKNSIRKNGGLIQNLVVELRVESNTEFKLVLVSGHRRLRALQELNFEKKVPVKIVDRKSVDISVEENILRKEMHFVEEAMAFERLALEKGWKQNKLKMYLGASEKLVQRYKKIASWPEELRKLILDNKDALNKTFVFHKCADKKVTSSEVEKILRLKISSFNRKNTKDEDKKIKEDIKIKRIKRLEDFVQKSNFTPQQIEAVTASFKFFKFI